MDAKDPLPSGTAAAPVPAATLAPSQAEHTATIDGQSVRYLARAAWQEIREPKQGKDGEHEGLAVRAQLFHMSYTRLDAKGQPDPSRPLLFVFNGGPGSSSVWLHLGLLGPQLVATDDFGRCGAAPYGLTDNPLSLLAQADLVFIDPIGTGLSTMQTGEKTTEFHDYQRDLDAIAEFIRVHLSREGRWGSPKYLMGESYGSTRGAALARQLQEKHQIHLNGVVLISLALDFQLFSFDPVNDLPYCLFLPTYAATAWFHQRLEPALQALPLAEVVRQAEAFALGAYASALLQGDRLDEAAQAAVAEQVAAFTGLSPTFVRRCRLRVSDERFFKELLRDQGLSTGRLDSRFTGLDLDDAGEKVEDDPSYSAMAGAFKAGVQRVLQQQFGWKGEAPYHLLAPLYLSWRFAGHENKYLATGPLLRDALHRDPDLRVYVASGYLDLATPHAAGDHSLAHLGLRPGVRDRLTVRYFEAGHMMYLHAPSRERLLADLRDFIR